MRVCVEGVGGRQGRLPDLARSSACVSGFVCWIGAPCAGIRMVDLEEVQHVETVSMCIASA